MKGIRIVCYNVLYLFSDGKNMLVNVTPVINLYTYKELLLLHQTKSMISNKNNHEIKRDIFYEWNTLSVYYSDVIIKRKLVQIVTLIASRSNWFCMVCPIEMWNRFYVLKFNFRCQIWNACRSQIRVVIWKLDLTNDIYWIRYKNESISQTILSH